MSDFQVFSFKKTRDHRHHHYHHRQQDRLAIAPRPSTAFQHPRPNPTVSRHLEKKKVCSKMYQQHHAPPDPFCLYHPRGHFGHLKTTSLETSLIFIFCSLFFLYGRRLSMHASIIKPVSFTIAQWGFFFIFGYPHAICYLASLLYTDTKSLLLLLLLPLLPSLLEISHSHSQTPNLTLKISHSLCVTHTLSHSLTHSLTSHTISIQFNLSIPFHPNCKKPEPIPLLFFFTIRLRRIRIRIRRIC